MSGLGDGEEFSTVRAGGGSGAFLCRVNPPFTLCVGELGHRGASILSQVTSRKGPYLGQKPLISLSF